MPSSTSSSRRLGTLACSVFVLFAALPVPQLGGQSPPSAPRLVQVTDTIAGQMPYVDWARSVSSVSHDGTLVAFLIGTAGDYTERRLYIGLTDAASPPQPITPAGLNVRADWGVFPPSFRPKIAFFACDNADCQISNAGIPGDVYVIGTDGLGLTQLTFDADPAGSWSPFWYEDAIASGDGRTVAYTRQTPSPTNPNPIKVEHLYLIDADGANRREIVLPASAFSGVVEWFRPLSFSADGTELAFVYNDFINSREGVQRIAAIRTDGTGFRTLVDPLTQATWVLSGDWTTLAYVTAEGLVVQRLRTPPGPPIAPTGLYPTISYDGGRICYEAPVAYQTYDVFCMNADGSDPRNVTNVPLGFQADYPVLSGDGSVVAFASAADLVAGRNGDNSREVFAAVFNLPTTNPTLNVDLSPRPQGQTFTFSGSGYTFDGSVTMTTVGPGGTTTATASADSLGRVVWSMPTTCATAVGDYVVTATDIDKALTSRSVTATVSANPACAPPPPPLPELSVYGVVVKEGNVGTTDAWFLVTLSSPTVQPVTVDYLTVDGSATTSGGDYQSASGTLTFLPGSTQHWVAVKVIGDTTIEADETFSLRLSLPIAATIQVGQATATVLDDDATNPCGRDRVRPDLTSQTDFKVLFVQSMLVSCDAATGNVVMNVTVSSHWKAWYKVTVSEVPRRNGMPPFFMLGPNGSRTFRLTLRRGDSINFFADATFHDDMDPLYAVYGLELIYRAVLGGPLPSSTANVIWDVIGVVPSSVVGLAKLGGDCMPKLAKGEFWEGQLCVVEAVEQIQGDPLVATTLAASGVPIAELSVVGVGKRLFSIGEFLANEWLAALEFTADTVTLVAR